MYCDKCGAKLPEGADFCANCGAVRSNVTPAAAPVVAVTASPIVAPKKKKKGLLIALIIVACVAVGLFAFAELTYSQAKEAMRNKDYQQAGEKFRLISVYKDSQEKADECYFEYAVQLLNCDGKGIDGISKGFENFDEAQTVMKDLKKYKPAKDYYENKMQSKIEGVSDATYFFVRYCLDQFYDDNFEDVIGPWIKEAGKNFNGKTSTKDARAAFAVSSDIQNLPILLDSIEGNGSNDKEYVELAKCFLSMVFDRIYAHVVEADTGDDCSTYFQLCFWIVTEIKPSEIDMNQLIDLVYEELTSDEPFEADGSIYGMDSCTVNPFVAKD